MVKPLDDWFRGRILGILILGVCGSTFAQDGLPNDYGTASTNYLWVSAGEFEPYSPDYINWMAGNVGARYVTGSGVAWLSAPVRLPTGALMTGMSVVYEDNDATGSIEVRLRREWWSLGSRGYERIGPIFDSVGVPGITRSYVDIDPDHTVTYLVNPFTVQAYRLAAYMNDGPALQLRGVIISWKRQISPEPAAATFPDVSPGFWAFQHIEALAASEITTGFPDGTFRPTDPVTRAQMATFLARALGLHWSP